MVLRWRSREFCIRAPAFAIAARDDIAGHFNEQIHARLRLTISMSLDGFVAGPNQSVREPLGVGGEGLHDWVVASWRERHGREGGEVNESTAVVHTSSSRGASSRAAR